MSLLFDTLRLLPGKQPVQLLAVGDMAFLIDIRNVSIYRGDADADALTDKSRRKTVHQQLHDFRLALREKVRLLEDLERRGGRFRLQEQVDVVILQQGLEELDQLKLLMGEGNILHPVQHNDAADAVLLVAQADPILW